jgi:hypothetical protein
MARALAERFDVVDVEDRGDAALARLRDTGKFTSTGGNIAEDLWSIMPSVSFRPTAQTVLRLNYRHQQQKDLLGNPPAKTGGFSFGVSTYF